MKDELINHLRKQLQEHEEPYAAGAWERFSDAEVKKPKFLLWPFWIAAAIVLVVSGFFLGYIYDKPNTIVLTNNRNDINNNSTQDEKNIDINSNLVEEINKPVSNSNIKSPASSTTYNSIKTSNNNAHENTQIAFNSIDEIINDQIFEPIISTEVVKPQHHEIINSELAQKTPIKTDKQDNIEEFLAKETIKLASNKNNVQNINKWMPELFIAPAIGNSEKLNINYGVSMNYALDDKLTIASGIAYNHLNSSRDVNAVKPQEMFINSKDTESSEKNLESMRATVRGITIPLDLKYNISKNLYSSVGVSAMAIINNTQSNSFLSYQVELNNAMSAHSSGREMIVTQKREVVNEKLNEVNQDRYIGFYNFSIGYKQKINNKNNIALEPYISIPMKSIKLESFNFSNGGFKLKYNF